MRIFYAIFLGSILVLIGCDDGESGAGGGDCTRAAYACSPGFTCANLGGGRTDCIPSRDTGGTALDALLLTDRGTVFDAIVTQDAELMKDEGNGTEDVFSPDDDMSTLDPSDDGVVATSDAQALEQPDAFTEPDAEMTPPLELDEGVPIMPDAAPDPPEDFGPPPMPDAAPPELDMAPPPPEPDMGPDDQFGPGRCNWGGMVPREARDLGGQDQNSARPIQPGRYEGLTVGGADFSDWHRVEVCENGVLMLRVTHGFNGSDVDLDVWHPREGRLGQSQGLCTGQESFRWQNRGEIVEIRFNVYPFAPPGANGNAAYDLEVLVMCP